MRWRNHVFLLALEKIWQARSDLNWKLRFWRPAFCRLKLHAFENMALARLERATSSFGNLRSLVPSELQSRKKLEWATGIEPATSGLEDRHSAVWVSLTVWFGIWDCGLRIFISIPNPKSQIPNRDCIGKDLNFQSANATVLQTACLKPLATDAW